MDSGSDQFCHQVHRIFQLGPWSFDSFSILVPALLGWDEEKRTRKNC